MIWFTADTHFGHAGILIHQPARLNAFEDVATMDDALCEGINKVLRPGDQLWHLGDFCWQASRAGHYRMRIHQPKVQFHMCAGNHDTNSMAKHCSTYQQMTLQKFRIEPSHYYVHMCHYPMWSWDRRPRGSYHLYGHCHGMAEDLIDTHQPGRLSLDVGIDNAWKLLKDWRPFSLEEVVNIILRKREHAIDIGLVKDREDELALHYEEDE